MTTQVKLNAVWAATGGSTDPGSVKYSTGWVSEIPTYQNFNFVLKTLSTNLLAFAEKGEYEWETGIAYQAGAVVVEAGKRYYCRLANLGQQPSLDTNNSYWIYSPVVGNAAPTTGSIKKGQLIKTASTQTTTTWLGNDVSIESIQPVIAFSSDGTGDNWLIGNLAGEMAVVNVGSTVIPDNRSIAYGASGVYKLYHQGFKPTQADVSGTIPDSPLNGTTYGRSNANWVSVTPEAPLNSNAYARKNGQWVAHLGTGTQAKHYFMGQF